MPRSNRPKNRRRARGGAWAWDEQERDDFARLRAGLRRTETKRGVAWTVQPIAPERALKEYTCPGCHTVVPIGQAHLVAWPAEHLFGDAQGVAERRHWHSHCWRMA